MSSVHNQFIFVLLCGFGCKGVTHPVNSKEPATTDRSSNITAVWANEGGDKVTRDELRSKNKTVELNNSVWDGTSVRLFGARNEVISFNLILEAASRDAQNVTIQFNRLTGPQGARIESSPTSGDGVFNWTLRPIELFYIRYL